MKTCPASMSSMKRSCSASSLVHAFDPSPKVVALAISMASSIPDRAVHRGDRSEDFFGIERHVLGDLGDHRRRVEPARPVGGLTAEADLGTRGDGVVDLLGDLVAA